MRIAFFSATLLVSGLALAATPIDGWYASVFGGYSYLPDNLSKTHRSIAFNHASYNNAYNVGGRIGVQCTPLRYEAEFTYLNASVKSFRTNRVENRILGSNHRAGGQSMAAISMANIYYDFPEMVPCIAPFVAAGLGYGWIEASLNSQRRTFSLFSPLSPFSPFNSFNNQGRTLNRIHFHGSNSVFAYQGTAGFTFNFVENYALNLAYRYIGTTRAENLGKVFQAHLASVGVVYRFNEYNYK